jgi:small subunit ribosomal protein S6
VREFETTFIVQPEISDEGLQAIRARLDAVLERHGAVRLMCDDLGRKRLAYEIRRFQKGHYLELVYLDRGPVVPEIERALRLDDSVLRFLTVQTADHVEDIEKRRAEAAALEEERARKAAERAAREAEEEAARAADEASGVDRDRDDRDRERDDRDRPRGRERDDDDADDDADEEE